MTQPRENRGKHVQINSKIWPVFRWCRREENNNNNSHPNLNICIAIPIFWNKTSSPAPTSCTSPARNWSTSFFFSSLPGLSRQRMEPLILCHRNILLRVNYGTLLQRASTHLTGIFSRFIFHYRERYNQIIWLERNKSSWTYVTAPV